jgi:AcrR family transcriptional regulator
MHAIAHAAGVGQGTLYRRYTNKGDLCFDLIKESAESLVADVNAFLQREADHPALSRLDGVLERVIAFTEEKLSMMSAIREAYCGENRHMQFANPYYLWIHGCISALFSEAVAQGDIAPLDPVITTDTLLGALAPQLYEFQRQERGMAPEEILAGLRRIYVTGLR